MALYFIAGNSPVTWIPRTVGTRTVINVDGLDWKREKWPTFAKRYIQFAEYLATLEVESSEDRVRSAMETERGYDPRVWQQLSSRCQFLGRSVRAQRGSHGGNVAAASGGSHRQLVSK